MYEQFTDRARKVMQLANMEAQRYNHEYVDTPHVLLGLIKEGNGVASVALRESGACQSDVVVKTLLLMPEGPPTVVLGRLPHSPDVKSLLLSAIAISDERQDGYVGTEHLLLGLLKHPSSRASEILSSLGVDTAVLNALAVYMGDPSPERADDSLEKLDKLCQLVLALATENASLRAQNKMMREDLTKIRRLTFPPDGAVDQIVADVTDVDKLIAEFDAMLKGKKKHAR